MNNKLHEELIKKKLAVFEKGARIISIELYDDTNKKYPDYIVRCRDFNGYLITIIARIMNNLYCEMRIIKPSKHYLEVLLEKLENMERIVKDETLIHETRTCIAICKSFINLYKDIPVKTMNEGIQRMKDHLLLKKFWTEG
jgi:hypothetical protein